MYKLLFLFVEHRHWYAHWHIIRLSFIVYHCFIILNISVILTHAASSTCSLERHRETVSLASTTGFSFICRRRAAMFTITATWNVDMYDETNNPIYSLTFRNKYYFGIMNLTFNMKLQSYPCSELRKRLWSRTITYLIIFS